MGTIIRRVTPGSADDGIAGVHCSAYFQLPDAVYYADYVLRAVLCGYGRTGITKKIRQRKLKPGFLNRIPVFLLAAM